MAKHITGTDGQGWYTKFHDRNEIIRRHLPRRQVPFAIAIYDVLVALANKHGDSRFEERIDTVCFHSAVSYNSVRRVLELLSGIVIDFTPPARGSEGRYALCQFAILKNTKSVQREIASTSQNPISTSRSTSDSTSRSTSATNLKLYRKKKKKEEITTTTATCARDEDIVRTAFEGGGFIFWNDHALAAVKEFSANVDGTLKALKKAGEKNVPPNRLIGFVRSFLEREANPQLAIRRNDSHLPDALQRRQGPADVWD